MQNKKFTFDQLKQYLANKLANDDLTPSEARFYADMYGKRLSQSDPDLYSDLSSLASTYVIMEATKIRIKQELITLNEIQVLLKNFGPTIKIFEPELYNKLQKYERSFKGGSQMTPKQYTLELVKRGYKVFPLVPNTKRPIKDQSYLTASNDLQIVAKWFDDLPQANLGLELASKSLIVVDIDNHNSTSIRDTMQKLTDQGCKLPAETYIEETPSGGLHFFYTGTVPIKRVTNFIPNVDLLADFTVIAPSAINGDAYRSINDQYNYSNIAKAPQWLIEAMSDKPKQFYSNDHPTLQTGKKWTGRRLDEIVNGVNAAVVIHG